jgi:hypothetical protein
LESPSVDATVVNNTNARAINQEFELMNLVTIRNRLAFWSTCLSLLLLAGELKALPLSLFNTGVNGTGTAWGSGGVADIHYTLLLQPSPGGGTAQTVTDGTYPFPPWLANNSGSRWIGPKADAFGPAGNYVYRTQFFVPPTAVLSSIFINGDWATDDTGANIRINGIPTGNTSPSYTALTPFSITSGFAYGVNNLDFLINNAGFSPFTNATGLRVDHIFGGYQVQLVPEPTSLALAGGLAFIGFVRLRRRRC